MRLKAIEGVSISVAGSEGSLLLKIVLLTVNREAGLLWRERRRKTKENF